MNKFRLFLLIVLFNLLFGDGSAQNWSKTAGGLTNDEALDVCSDASGNYYVTGYFTYSATFGSTVLTSNGYSDIFIAKYNASGNIQWAKKAGGNGPDRGYSIYADNSGNIYLTGYYSGPANFDGTTVNSVSNTQDVFIAKYDTNGNLSWVRSVGGNQGETGYGICADNNGNVIVTGQYTGQSTFGSVVLNSTIDPYTNIQSYDLFVVKYDSTGNFQWVQGATAKYDDRGMDVRTDDANNIFVVGQYSDTITVDNVYYNYVMNAGFLLKLDPSGAEQWFKSMSGVQTIIYGVAVDASNNVFITGDFKGTLSISGSPPTYVNGNYFNKILVAKFNNSNGNVIWAQEDASKNEVTSKSIAVDANGDVYIAGLFKCRFTDYSDLYGTGIFYSAGYRDVFMTKYSSTGTRIWQQHHGGPKDDYCSGIALAQINNPVIAGSFEDYFNLPYDITYGTLQGTTLGNYNCSDYNYGNYIHHGSTGQKDIFVSRPYVQNHSPLDYYTRTGVGCLLDSLKPCINLCLDTIARCGSSELDLYTFTMSDTLFGPRYNFLWNDGSTSQINYSDSTGWYWVQTTREDGCWTSIDSIYVIEWEYPTPPLITDSWGININHPQFAIDIGHCGPDSVIITGSGVFFPADTAYWTGNYTSLINDSTILVTQSGIFAYSVYTVHGCTDYNEISVDLPIPDSIYPTAISFHYSDSHAELTDTLIICQGGGMYLGLSDSIHNSVPEVSAQFSIYYQGNFISSGSSGIGDGVYNYFFFPTVGGLYSFVVDTLVKNCDTVNQLNAQRNVFVIINPNPSVYLTISGPTGVCPGDTITLYINTNTTNFVWSGANIIADYTDSVDVLAVFPSTMVYASGSITNPVTGCSTSASDAFGLTSKSQPLITMNPADGIVCPGDSILLTAPPGVSWQWVGPQGNNIGNTQQIYVDLPGYYHCIHTDVTGCLMTTNFVEAKEYNTPFLDVYPSNHICANGNTTLQVVAASNALIQWQAPLSGNSVTQVVSSPGTYVCHITLCGITTIDSITVIQSNTPAYIIAQDSTICPGDSILLIANGGMMDYNWSPGGSHDPFLYITQPGSYTVQTTDAYGCFGNSAPLVISAMPQPPVPSVNDTTICAGNPVVLNAVSANPVYWFSTMNATTPFFIGNNYSSPVITNNTTYYVQSHDSVCSSNKIPLHVTIYSSSSHPVITGDTTVCEGQFLFLQTTNIANASYFWSGPNGISSDSSALVVFPIDTSYSGIYQLYYSDSNCVSPVRSIQVVVSPLPHPYILPDTTIYLCPGNSIVLADTNNYSAYQWSPGTQITSSITVSTAGTYSVSATQNGCTNTSNAVVVSLFNPANNPSASNTTICPNTSATLNASGSGTINWYDNLYQFISTGNTFTTPALSATTMYYIQSVSVNGCLSQFVPVYVFVATTTMTPVINVNQPVCEGESILLSTAFVPGGSYLWSGPNGFSSNAQNPVITNVDFSNAGTYQLVINLNGCASGVASINVTVHSKPNAPSIIGDSVFCEGEQILLSCTSAGNYTYSWQTAAGSYYFDTTGIEFPASIWENGITNLFITDSIGCSDTTSILLTINPTPYTYLTSSSPVCVDQDIFLYASCNYPANYSWSGPDGFNSVNLYDTVFHSTANNNGYYVLHSSYNGCDYTDSVSIAVVEYPVVYLTADTTICEGGTTYIEMDPAYNYFWNDGTTNPYFVATDSGWVYVQVTAGPGCMISDSLYLGMINCNSIVPNAMSPNNDGINDYFTLFNDGAKSMHVIIFDRWGKIINEWDELNGKWYGDTKSGEMAPDGVYFYVVDVVNYYSEREIIKGFVHLFR